MLYVIWASAPTWRSSKAHTCAYNLWSNVSFKDMVITNSSCFQCKLLSVTVVSTTQSSARLCEIKKDIYSWFMRPLVIYNKAFGSILICNKPLTGHRIHVLPQACLLERHRRCDWCAGHPKLQSLGSHGGFRWRIEFYSSVYRSRSPVIYTALQRNSSSVGSCFSPDV